MVELIRIDSWPVDPDLLSRLQAHHEVFVDRPDDPLAQEIANARISIKPLQSELPDGAVCLLIASPLDRLAAISRRLLGPGGCPWDQAQTHESLRKYLVEETYEVIDAIDRADREALCEELGDLLLQPLMHAEISRIAGGFGLDEVADGISEKLVRRHPHVFGETSASTAEEVLQNWDAIKRTEKPEGKKGILDGLPKAMPALLRALESSKRAARAGFEWPTLESVFEKLDEERAELNQAIEEGDKQKVEAELGDLLFTLVNVARWLKVDPEEALRSMVDRFTRRFTQMEASASKPLEQLSAQEWDDLWNRAKLSHSLTMGD